VIIRRIVHEEDVLGGVFDNSFKGRPHNFYHRTLLLGGLLGHNFRHSDVVTSPVVDPPDDLTGCTTTPKFALLSVFEKFESRVALDSVLLGQLLFFSSVNLSDVAGRVLSCKNLSS